LALRSLEHLHLHVNPAWRAALQPSAVAAMAAAWPCLTHLHLRLSPSDNATHALQQLGQFKSLKHLSLTWLGQAAAAGAGHAVNRGRRGSSLESAAFNLAYLPEGLEVGSGLGLGAEVVPLCCCAPIKWQGARCQGTGVPGIVDMDCGVSTAGHAEYVDKSAVHPAAHRAW
jgi:hypothetical protein